MLPARPAVSLTGAAGPVETVPRVPRAPEVLTWKEACLLKEENVTHTERPAPPARLERASQQRPELGLVTATAQCCPTDHRLLGLSAVSEGGCAWLPRVLQPW